MISENNSPTLFAEAQQALDDGNTEEAIAIYLGIVAEGGEESMTALFAAATCYARRKQWQESESLLNKVIDEQPTFAPAYAYRGVVRFEENLMDSSLADLDKALELDSKNAIVRLKRGEIFFRLGLLKEAQNEVHAAAKLKAPDTITRDYIRKLVVVVDKASKKSFSRDVAMPSLGWLKRLRGSEKSDSVITTSH